MKILVVDDEVNALQIFLNEIINIWDVEYKFSRDDVPFICGYISTNQVDAVFLDINMPNINGVELAKKLIKINPSLKIVFITGLLLKEEDLPIEVKEHTVGFLYKPYNQDTLRMYLSIISKKERKMIVKTFDTFDCFIDGRPIYFSSYKSKELFALLITYNGVILHMNDAISQLWPDKPTDKSKILYRDAVWRLRKTLNDIEMQCVIFDRGRLRINKSLIDCDYWKYLSTGEGDYNGEFCKSYDWSIDFLGKLDAVKANK